MFGMRGSGAKHIHICPTCNTNSPAPHSCWGEERRGRGKRRGKEREEKGRRRQEEERRGKGKEEIRRKEKGRQRREGRRGDVRDLGLR